MRRLDPASYRTMPWKNGGGTTHEVWSLPADSDLETFEARISLARVERDGPFSAFPGVDRTTVVIEGVGMTLSLSDESTVVLDQSSRPFAFTGGDSCVAKLTEGPIVDFNVMTRRKVLRHRLRRAVLEGEQSLTCPGELTALMLLGGAAVAKEEDTTLSLKPRDILLLSPGEPIVCLSSEGRRELLLVDIWRK